MPGPGYDRFRSRIDHEALRKQVLKEQQDALENASTIRKKAEAANPELRHKDLPPVNANKYYPKPKGKKK